MALMLPVSCGKVPGIVDLRETAPESVFAVSPLLRQRGLRAGSRVQGDLASHLDRT